ncbi:cytochrome c peroxidase [Rubricoccus marinus]|uniref:Cytochrome c domain-containing protein n=1 Tax=Rubricoccus marinus TaxID=716817 RepID=A0A259TY60_9BACT|nr:cytochrome c peroxidase [Rubricoccus marinus]OZC02557.1 hypothetical protein BSZ36_05940 [Rubricoccus marinus]
MIRAALTLLTSGAVLLAAFSSRVVQEPDLPETPLEYADIPLPAHLTITPVRALDNTPEDNPITNAGATLGRVLFYDTRLSDNLTVSCGTCHRAENGFSDPRPKSVGLHGSETPRHSMGLAFARYYGSGAMFWDERSATLEEQVLVPIEDPVEMGLSLDVLTARLDAEPFYADLFTAAFGSPEASGDRIARALAQFVRSMVAADSRYDRARAATPGRPDPPLAGFTAAENRGLGVFTRAGRCNTCHLGDLFVGDIPRNNGLDAVTTDPGAGGGRFKAPSLRNVGLTAPYMHDGRFATLEEVVEHYDSGVQDHPQLDARLRAFSPTGNANPPRRLGLSDQEKADLVAFLHTLTDVDFTTDERWQDPFRPSTATAAPEASRLRLDAPSPNPASGATAFRFALGAPGPVALEVFDARGRRVAMLANGNRAAGEHTVRLNAAPLAPGAYVARLRTGGESRSVRFAVAR